jgi:hypothetical protein
MQRIILIFAILVACQAGPQKEVAVKKNSPSPTLRVKDQTSSKNTFEIATLQSANGWGYQIRQNGKLLLDQPVIPGRPGNAGFQTQADAQRVAELVKTKLQAKVFPPTVSEDDLKNLNIH